jgi:TonB family protein
MLLGLLGALPAAASPPTGNFQARLRANDAPVAGRFTIAAYLLDSLDVTVPRPGPGRLLLLRFYDSNGKDAFIVPSDFEMGGAHRTATKKGLRPVGAPRLGGSLGRKDSRWALWWLPMDGKSLDWEGPVDLQLRYGFFSTEFVPLSRSDTKDVLAMAPWADLQGAVVDTSSAGDDRHALDAAAFDQPPVARVRRDPPYPESAKMFDFQGSLYVAVHVSDTGKVEDAYVLQSNAIHDLNVAALAAVMDWEFRPGLKSGKPVAGDIVIPIKFDLGSVK